MSLRFALIAGHVARCGTSDRNHDEGRASMRSTRGPPDQRSNTCFNWTLSEIIRAVNLASYYRWDRLWSVDLSTYHERWIKIQQALQSDVPPSSCDEITSRSFTKDQTIINRRKRFTKGRFIATVDRDAPLHRTVTPKIHPLNAVLRDGKSCSWIF